MLPIYVLSLESRPDRKEVITAELIEHDLYKNAVFVKAFTPDSDRVRYLGGRLDLSHVRSHGAPLGHELSCLATHLEGLRLIVDSGRPGIILEDDAVLHREFCERWKLVEAMITPEHELIYLGCEGALPKDLSDTKLIQRRGIVWSATGYWVTPVRAKRMIEKYGVPMTHYGLRTSECISLLGPSHQITPLLVLEEPYALSSMRPRLFSNLKLKNLTSWGLENYGGEYRRGEIARLPFTILMIKLEGKVRARIYDQERSEIEIALEPYLKQEPFRKLRDKYLKD